MSTTTKTAGTSSETSSGTAIPTGWYRPDDCDLDEFRNVVEQSTELSFAGVGASVGAVQQLGRSLWVAAMARSDGGASVERDSAPVGDIDLPYSVGLGLRWRAGARLDLAGHGIFRTWSGANSDLLAVGGSGSDNTVEVAFGGEFVPDPRRPSRTPIRFDTEGMSCMRPDAPACDTTSGLKDDSTSMTARMSAASRL